MATKKTAIDFRASMQSLAQEAERATEARFGDSDRFSRAASIIQSLPSGLHRPQPQSDIENAQHAIENARNPNDNDVIWVEISRVRDNPCNARQVYDQQKINERAASIAKDGQMTPAPACLDFENPDSGGYILIGGHYRKKALLQLNKPMIQIKLLAVTSHLELHRLSHEENSQREEDTPLDNALSWKNLLAEGYATQEQIAESLGIARTRVTKTMKILDLPSDVLEIVKEAPAQFSLTSSYILAHIAKMVDVKESISLATKIKN